MRVRITLVLIASLLSGGCWRAERADPRVVAEWMRALYGTIRVERLSPPVASRLMAYATTALYSGYVAGDPALPSLDGSLNGLPALPRAARPGDLDGARVAVEAVRVLLDSLLVEALPTTRAALARLADSLRAESAPMEFFGVSGAPVVRSDSVGGVIGRAIVAWARSDGFSRTRTLPPYRPPSGPAFWANDAPATTFTSQSISGASELITPANPANQLRDANTSDRALVLGRPKRAGATSLPAVNMAGASEPYWGQVRPFVLERWDSCPLAPPPPYSTEQSSMLRTNAQQVVDAKASLTAEQRTIALFWADNAGESGTPVGHWISIASQMVSQRNLSAPEAARIMMLTAVAQADAFIASWGYKYTHNLLRPRMYIRRVIDPEWEPLIPTPPFPEYPSGHSTQSAAAATTLAGVLGDGAFDDSTSISIGHAVRRFPSFMAAAEEAGMSRIYGGIHFEVGNRSGRDLGICIGERVLARAAAQQPNAAR